MLKKTMTYIDYDGNERTEDFYFNLSKAELTEIELTYPGGMDATIKSIVNTQDTAKLVEIFKDLILRSYGEKSLDGKYFVKNEEVRAKFSQTEAYSDLFMELATNSDSAAAFVNGIIPEIKDEEVKNKPKVVPIENKDDTNRN